MTTVPVTTCFDCPFADVSDDKPHWLCRASEDDNGLPPDLGPRKDLDGYWLPPPAWCPLRLGDRVVRLKTKAP